MQAQRARRRSPQWVRALRSDVLHAIAGRFHRAQRGEDLTAAQEWLWAAVISELEYRHRHPAKWGPRCWCDFCVEPFPD